MGETVEEGGPICTAAVTYKWACLKCGAVATQSVGPTGHQIGLGGNCNACGQHIEHQWLWDEVDQKYYCYCGAEKD